MALLWLFALAFLPHRCVGLPEDSQPEMTEILSLQTSLLQVQYTVGRRRGRNEVELKSRARGKRQKHSWEIWQPIFLSVTESAPATESAGIDSAPLAVISETTTPSASASVWEPLEEGYDEAIPKNIAIVIPYRNRKMHLERFNQRMEEHVDFWEKRGVHHNLTVYVVEQFDEKLFNRGWLLNIGVNQAMRDAETSGQKLSCIVTHDVDTLPFPEVDYGWCTWPTQLSSEHECFDWSVPYPEFSGAVLSMSPAHWQQVNGYSNSFWGWGGEDDDLYWRLRQQGLLHGKYVDPETTVLVEGRCLVRPPKGRGRFNCINDQEHTPRIMGETEDKLLAQIKPMQEGSQRWRQDGLNTVEYFNTPRPTQPLPLEEDPSRSLLERQLSVTSAGPIKTLRVWFTDMWQNFDPSNNFFVLLLERTGRQAEPVFTVELDNEKPDVLIYSGFGDDHSRYPQTPKVFYTGENQRPRYESSVLNLGFDYGQNDTQYIRLPLWMLYIDWLKTDPERLRAVRNPLMLPESSLTTAFPQEELANKKSFCAFVVSNCDCEQRNWAFMSISVNVAQVDSPGACMHNMDAALDSTTSSKLDFLKPYRFVMAYENSQWPGYTTEKLLHAKAVGAVPIYWGDPLVFMDFDPASFINTNGLTQDEVNKKVTHLRDNYTEWLAIASTPLMNQTAVARARELLDQVGARIARIGLGENFAITTEATRAREALALAQTIAEQRAMVEQNQEIEASRSFLKRISIEQSWQSASLIVPANDS